MYGDLYTWATDAGGDVFLKYASHHIRILDATSACALDYDWLSKKLYWSSCSSPLSVSTVLFFGGIFPD